MLSNKLIHPIGNDILHVIFGHLSSSTDLFRCALVTRQWKPLANARLYRHVRLNRRENFLKFYACLLLRSPNEDDRSQRCSLVRTLRVELIDPSGGFQVVNRNMEAYRKLGDILRHLSCLKRLLMEVYVGTKLHEYSWIQNLVTSFPKSLHVFMIRVSFMFCVCITIHLTFPHSACGWERNILGR